MSAVTSARVYVDGDLNTVLDATSFNGSVGTFNGLNIVVPKGGTKVITVLVDTETSYNTALTLTFTFNNFDIDDDAGNNVANTVSVVSAVFTVLDSAAITASNHSTTPQDQLIPSQELTTIAQFKIKAIDDQARIQELALVNVAPTFTADAATGGTARVTTADGTVLSAYDENNNFLGQATIAS